uniref:mitogen-activated protein kinase kinase kinase 7-like isoform X2 n=1 Tax=Ciona intestinalis TaxID=7719 RepID=UPI000EF49108|nr:mitogen-activated protein kinase kinase kinase 7-like isoform X2 [Ciona intestinalis]|eukprot:XP_026693493.1 mitogen-activated protein kinase kinase kinase 7-like isoform X2 [Ciona intestinalis]
MLCKPNLDTTLLKCEVNSSAVLGTGCSGTTYKALHGVYGDVAAKLLKYNNDVNRKAANEIDLLSSINGNKFVVNYFGWNYVKHSGIEYPLIVMEYMECGSLHDVLYKDSSIDFHYSLRKRAMKEFAEGLRFLHFHLYGKHPIVHCDLKPQNLLFTAEMHLKISDLGSAVRCWTAELKLKGNRESVYVSTRYCAPELFNWNLNQRLKPEVDVYSYGIILWETMVREEPYKYAKNDDVIKVAVMTCANRPSVKPKFLTEKGISYDMKTALIAVCPLIWHKTPSMRPSAEQLTQLINEYFPFSRKEAMSEGSKFALQKLPEDPRLVQTEPLTQLIKRDMQCKVTENGGNDFSISIPANSMLAEENVTSPKLPYESEFFQPQAENFQDNTQLQRNNTQAEKRSRIDLQSQRHDQPVQDYGLNMVPISPQRQMFLDGNSFPSRLDELPVSPPLLQPPLQMVYPVSASNDRALESRDHPTGNIWSNHQRTDSDPCSETGDFVPHCASAKEFQRCYSTETMATEYSSASLMEDHWYVNLPSPFSRGSQRYMTFHGSERQRYYGSIARSTGKSRTRPSQHQNEPYNEFIIISQKHYEAYSPAIDVVLLCFACDAKKSLDQLKQIWSNFSRLRNMQDIPVVVVMTKAEKMKTQQYCTTYSQGKVFSEALNAPFHSYTTGSKQDLEKAFQIAYEKAKSKYPF